MKMKYFKMLFSYSIGLFICKSIYQLIVVLFVNLNDINKADDLNNIRQNSFFDFYLLLYIVPAIFGVIITFFILNKILNKTSSLLLSFSIIYMYQFVDFKNIVPVEDVNYLNLILLLSYVSILIILVCSLTFLRKNE